MIRLIFLAVLISCGAWGGLSALASEGWGGGNLHLIQEEKPELKLVPPQCTKYIASDWLNQVKTQNGIADDKIHIHSEPEIVERAKQLYGGAQVEVDTVILIEASGGTVVIYAHNGVVCGMVLAPGELGGRVMEFVLGRTA